MTMAKREVFKAPEVCEMAQLQPYVLRTWEAEFPALGQATNGGARLYRRADVEMVLRIKQLVFGEGLTLAGARRRLEEQQSEPSIAAVALDDVLGGLARTRLRQVRSGLEAILKMLEKDAEVAQVPARRSLGEGGPRVPKVPKVPPKPSKARARSVGA